jgi:hypothetical protein
MLLVSIPPCLFQSVLCFVHSRDFLRGERALLFSFQNTSLPAASGSRDIESIVWVCNLLYTSVKHFTQHSDET